MFLNGLGRQVSLQFFDDYSLLHETCGQLGWLEEPTGLPLFASLARLLAGVA
ncbi:MAG TPA: hypothetical protein VHD63_24195 [Ktedonobacteraceae bacterium]|nr:hypothetical protein [Ktedonobacteraceae bacterium]